MIELRVFNKENKFELKKKYEYDAGIDIITKEKIVIPPGIHLIKTGIYFTGFYPYEVQIGDFKFVPELQVRSRSGLATKGIIVNNSPGTIDAGYRGEIGIILYNETDTNFVIEVGKGIAQLVPALVLITTVSEVSEEFWSNSFIDERGTGGFGHTDGTGR